MVTEVNKSDLRQKPYTVEFDNGEIHHYRYSLSDGSLHRGMWQHSTTALVATRHVATRLDSARCNAD